MQMSFSAQDEAGLRQFFKCFAKEVFLNLATPELAVAEWPSAQPPGVELDSQGHPGGYLYYLKLDSLPDRLKRYQTTLHSLSETSTLVGFFLTDGEGITIVGALAVTSDGRRPKVSHLLMDEKFEE